MGRLAKRMAARDYIDRQNLGMGSKATKVAKASYANSPGINVKTEAVLSEDGMPSKISMGGKVEMEHKGTIGKITDKKEKDVARMIAKDHIKEDPNYYAKLRKAGL